MVLGQCASLAHLDPDFSPTRRATVKGAKGPEVAGVCVVESLEGGIEYHNGVHVCVCARARARASLSLSFPRPLSHSLVLSSLSLSLCMHVCACVRASCCAVLGRQSHSQQGGAPALSHHVSQTHTHGPCSHMGEAHKHTVRARCRKGRKANGVRVKSLRVEF